MTREEAINTVRNIYQTDKEKEALETLIPELRESEDERIRKFLIKLVNDGLTSFPDSLTRSDVLAYLEKQKVIAAIPDELVECYKNLCEISQDILINSEEDKQIDEITHDVRSLLDYPIKQKPVEWKPQPESLEALMYAIEGKWDMISPTSYLSRRLEDLYEGLVNTYNVDEPPLAELPKTAYTAKDIEEIRALKDKIDASMDEKPVEWSDEDEEALDMCLDAIPKAWKTKSGILLTKWLKEHFSPSWKPSEEQMEALERTIRLANFGSEENRRKALESLHDQLKKLTQEG